MSLSYFEALKRYNAGMGSWCIPRKGSVGYETIVKLRKGDNVETPKQIVDRLERKTVGRGKKEKKEKKTINIKV